MDVLKNRNQIRQSRRMLRELGASSLETLPERVLRTVGLRRGPRVGDWVKSWDVLRTVEFLRSCLPNDQPVLDIGCYCSEVLIALHRVGYKNLFGADLDPRLEEMPFQANIRYEVCNFMETPFQSETFSAITAISVIEHGFDGSRLLSEVSRLLKPGGYFIASFDYWPEKLDTTGVTFFGLEWTIFSEKEIREFTSLAQSHSLVEVDPGNPGSEDSPIHFGGKEYTFGWLVLQKSAGP